MTARTGGSEVCIREIIGSSLNPIPYENVGPGRTVVIEKLPVHVFEVLGLPDALGAIVAAADLQGRERRAKGQDTGRLLGELLAEELERLAELGELPPLDTVGVILGGDLYARPEMDRRGGSGDVRGVWDAFAQRCRWVVGVAGNHDVFGPGPSEPHLKAFKHQPKIHLLDGNCVELDGLRIAGLSGIVGNPKRPWRRLEQDFAEWIELLAADRPDILVMHDGPDVSGTDLLGWPSIRMALEQSRPTLVIRGHAHWDSPLQTLANGTQVLNVDARVAILRPTAPATNLRPLSSD